MAMILPNDAKKLISLLEQNGYSAYAVGGCVRDALMGVEPKDVDIATSALPNQTQRILEDNNIRIVLTGLKHGTVTAVVNHTAYEITTFRNDGEYGDNRHPDSVVFIDNIKDDLSRRDFTMNAIAYNDNTGYVDCFDGVADINNKLIRSVGNPDKRFNEDALRIMRALRFASVLGFDIDEKTSQAVFDNRELLSSIAAERIYAELVKLLCGDNCEEVLLKYKEVLAVVIPELKPTFTCTQNSKWHLYDVYTHIVKSVAVSPKKDYIRLAVFLHDIAKPQCKTTDEKGVDHFKTHCEVGAKIAFDILKRLKVSNEVLNKTITLIRIHDDHITTKPSNIKKWLRLLGEELTFDFIDLKIADMKSHNLFFAQTELDELEYIRTLTAEVIASGEPYRISDLAINGNDLTALGYKGHQIADELNSLVKIVSGNPACNTKEKLLHQAQIDIKNTTE